VVLCELIGTSSHRQQARNGSDSFGLLTLPGVRLRAHQLAARVATTSTTSRRRTLNEELVYSNPKGVLRSHWPTLHTNDSSAVQAGLCCLCC